MKLRSESQALLELMHEVNIAIYSTFEQRSLSGKMFRTGIIFPFIFIAEQCFKYFSNDKL